jgi:hypothetical protein
MYVCTYSIQYTAELLLLIIYYPNSSAVCSYLVVKVCVI